MTSIARIALCGSVGTGKSTVRGLSQRLASELAFELHHVRLADPLYAAQQEIYRLAGRPLLDVGIQDGHLLNVLGSEMRRINPDVLADQARARLLHIGEAIEMRPGRHAVVCDDMRPVDAAFMKELGFEFVEVVTTAAIATERRLGRGDLTLGATDDPTERGLEDLDVWTTIENRGSIDDLDVSVRRFWERVFP